MDVSVGELKEDDLPAADRLFRLSFGTLFHLPDPMKFYGDADLLRTRWKGAVSHTIGATVGGEFVGLMYATSWGSVGWFGPLAVRPDYWNKGIGSILMERTVKLFDRWKVRLAGLTTFPENAKNVSFYQKFEFWPGLLTSKMIARVDENERKVERWVRFSELPEKERAKSLHDCTEITDSIYGGLNVEREIESVFSQKLGDTVLLLDRGELVGFAVCHVGPGTEAGSGKCYVKVGAVRPGPKAEANFDKMMAACKAFASKKRVPLLAAGVNTARHRAYRRMLASGFRLDFQALAMHRPNDPGYDRPDVYFFDDWL
jgi:GNAT superfamily N-acetyltransferase